MSQAQIIIQIKYLQNELRSKYDYYKLIGLYGLIGLLEIPKEQTNG